MHKVGLLGEKLSHSYSPLIHSCLADYEYKLFEKNPHELDEFFKIADFDGINVTIPYKKAVIPYCSQLSESAQKTGSVNTIVKMSDGKFFGDNTDCFGFEYMLKKLGVCVSGKKALILGSGGSSLTVRTVLENLGTSEIIIISRSGENNYHNIEKHSDAQIIVNATPVGMYPNNGILPINLADFARCEFVLDLIYNPSKTALLLEAEDRKIPHINGLSMLIAQAKRAAEIFLNKSIPDSLIDTIQNHIEQTTQNIVLIGMPGCGKSSIGAELARITEREFFDTDQLIEQKIGKSTSLILEQYGEDFFRSVETSVLCEISKKSSLVIATGGGIIKRNENFRLIHQNSTTIYLERELSELPVDGRPLSLRIGIEALAQERIPIYKKWSDTIVPVCGIEKTAIDIAKLLKLDK